MKYKILSMALLVLSLVGCKDYLDLVPEDDIVSLDAVFEKRSTAMDYLSTCYMGLFQTQGLEENPGICGADELMSGEYSRNATYSAANFFDIPSFKIAEGKMNASNPIYTIWGKRPKLWGNEHSPRYERIRHCNTFIAKVDEVYDMTLQEKRQYKAEVKAIKAYYYLELIMQYGPIVLVPENIPVEADIKDMQIARSHVDTCFYRVVKLFDEAIPDLKTIDEMPKNRVIYMTKEAAYGMKAKALVWAASPLYNGNEWYANFKNRDGKPLFNSSYDAKKWEVAAKALDKAVEFCEAQGRELHSGSGGENSDMLNTIEDIHMSNMPVGFTQKEYLFAAWGTSNTEIDSKLPRYNSKDGMFNGQVKGCINPTLRMVEAFYTENGLPINMDSKWSYFSRYKMGKEKSEAYNGVVALNNDVLQLHLRREPRFYANIAADRCFWKMGSDNVEMNAHQGERHGNELTRKTASKPQNLTGYWVKKHVLTDNDGRNKNKHAPISILRMADLYLMQAEAWNEVNGPSGKVYEAIDKVRKRAGIPGVKEAWLNYSKNPGKVSTKLGLREIIRQERTVEFAFEGKRFWDLRRWKTAHLVMNTPLKGWKVFESNADKFYNSGNGPVDVWTENKFTAPRDYFWPIRDEEVLVSNIVQNLGW